MRTACFTPLSETLPASTQADPAPLALKDVAAEPHAAISVPLFASAAEQAVHSGLPWKYDASADAASFLARRDPIWDQRGEALVPRHTSAVVPS